MRCSTSSNTSTTISNAPSVGFESLLSNKPDGKPTFFANITDLGTRLPAVTLLKKLAQGACGKVFVAKLDAMPKSIAVKVISKDVVIGYFK
jgi:hypothetical protein